MLGIKQKTVHVIDESFIVVGHAYALHFTDYGDEIVIGLCLRVTEICATFIIAAGPMLINGNHQTFDVSADDIAAGKVNILGGYAYSPKINGNTKQIYEIPKSLIPPIPGGGVALCASNPAPLVINNNPVPLFTHAQKKRPITLTLEDGYAITYMGQNPDGSSRYVLTNPKGEKLNVTCYSQEDEDHMYADVEGFWKSFVSNNGSAE